MDLAVRGDDVGVATLQPRDGLLEREVEVVLHVGGDRAEVAGQKLATRLRYRAADDLEGRAGYYDRAGALIDMVQNHLLQLLCLIAMEPPATVDPPDLGDRKVEVLRAARDLTDGSNGPSGGGRR